MTIMYIAGTKYISKFCRDCWQTSRRTNFLRLLPLLIMPLFYIEKKIEICLGFYYYVSKNQIFAKPCKLLETLASFPKFSL